MSGMSYLAVVERYHQYRNALSELLSSILTGMGDTQLLTSNEARHKAMVGLGLYVYLGAQAEALLAAPPPRQ